MGRFVNPDNSAFQDALNSKIYMDKTGLLEYTNSVIDTMSKFICNSRPRRFGKTITADMLTAYYSRSCDSRKMFSDLTIGQSPDWGKYLNHFNVIHFDVQWCMTSVNGAENVVSFIEQSVISELKEVYTDLVWGQEVSLSDALSRVYNATGDKFIVIIDEWDVLIRDEANNADVQEQYVRFLRGMFKGTEPTKYIALAYLTGILPIKRLKTQSALNNFDEFTMLDAGAFAPYIGFTSTEVKTLCETYGIDYEKVCRWYDGYLLNEYHVYNPKAVVSVMQRKTFQSYWSQTSTYETIQPFVNMNFDGLKTSIMTMLSGDEVRVRTTTYQNDMVTFKNKDDVLTLLIHLGYLAYHQDRQTAYIPNEEIRGEFVDAVEENHWTELQVFEKLSMDLLEATLDKDADRVAKLIEKIHMDYASTIQYNNENSLSSVLTIAYLSSLQYYFRPVRELPTGRGFADFVFIPKTEYQYDYPALVVELKWNQDVKTALSQVRDKQYPQSLLQYTGNILLVGINYDKRTKEHQCQIEEYEKADDK